MTNTAISSLLLSLLLGVSFSARSEIIGKVLDTTPITETAEKVELRKNIKSTSIVGLSNDSLTAERQRDSIYHLIGKFYTDQFRNFQDPRAPYFMFMSKGADLTMGIGGLVRMRGWYDWGGSIPANGFSPYFIQIPENPLSQRRLDATPAGTGLYLTLIAHKDWLGYLTAYIEGNFDGYQHVGFKLKKAYVTLNDWTVGYTTSTFSDPAAVAPTIDGAGPNGKVTRTNVLLRYLKTFKNRWSVGGSFEFPSAAVTQVENETEKCSDYVPDIAAMGQYQWDDGVSHVRLSALMRVMTYRDLLTSTNHNVFGWGAMASAVVKLANPLTFYATLSYGKGVGSYQGEFAAASVDLVPDMADMGKLTAPRSFGITAGFKYYFLYNLYSAIAFGRMQYDSHHVWSDSQYKSGMYGAVNIFWDMSARIQVGAEYLIGERRNFNGEHASANRVDALFQFCF